MFLRILLCVSAVTVAVSVDPFSADGCGGTYNETTGNFTSPTTDPGANTNCTWFIKTNEANPSVMLQFVTLDFSGGNDMLTVFAADTNTSIVIAAFKNATGPVTVISPDKVTKIVFQRGSEANMTGKFSAVFNTVNCTQTISALQGVITSPIYLNGTGEVSCTSNVAMTGNKDVVLLSMKEFSLPNGTLNVTFDTTTTLSGEGKKDDLFGPDGTQSFTLKLSLKNDARPQKFTALFSTVNKDCSGHFIATDKAGTLTLPVTQFPTTCHAQIAADPNKTVYATSSSQTTKSVLLYDGGSVDSPLIGDFHTGSWYGSSGQTMTLVANLDGSSTKTTTVSYNQPADRALYSLALGKSVTLQLTTETSGDEATKSIQFLTDKNSKLSIMFNNNTKLSNNATVILQDGGDTAFGTQLFSFRADTTLFPVVSPNNRLIVVIKDVTGDNMVDITVSAVTSGCSQVYTASLGYITWQHFKNDTQCTLGIINASSMASTDIMTFEVSTLTLCGNSTLSVYKGFQKTAPLLATYNSSSAPVLNVRVQASVGAKLVWSDPKSTCSGAAPILKAFYWTQSAGAACGGDFSNKTSGSITSPGFPDTYPLNTHCNYPLKNVAKASLYVTLSAVQLDPLHNLTLRQNDKIIRYFRNTTSVFNNLTVDAIVPAGNLSLDFNAMATGGTTGQMPNAGYSLSFRFLTCGGVVTGTNSTIASPVNLTQSTECIWIIQMKQNGANDSVNVVAANISVSGLTNKSSNIFEIRDGGSARADLVQLNGTTTSFLSRTNFLWIRYYIHISNKTGSLEANTPFTFSVNYTQHNCNSSTRCANGFCMHNDWLCNGKNDCGDWSDESHCNGSRPFTTTTVPTPQPQGGGSKGVKAYWIVICLILGIIMGAVLTFVIPAVYRRIKYPNYTHLRDAMAPSEA